MDSEYIKDALKKIEAFSYDYEAAHSLEDDLVWKFVESIAKERTGMHGVLARLIMKSKAIDFPRYTA